jgi:hypothetical protein
VPALAAPAETGLLRYGPHHQCRSCRVLRRSIGVAVTLCCTIHCGRLLSAIAIYDDHRAISIPCGTLLFTRHDGRASSTIRTRHTLAVGVSSSHGPTSTLSFSSDGHWSARQRSCDVIAGVPDTTCDRRASRFAIAASVSRPVHTRQQTQSCCSRLHLFDCRLQFLFDGVTMAYRRVRIELCLSYPRRD